MPMSTSVRDVLLSMKYLIVLLKILWSGSKKPTKIKIIWMEKRTGKESTLVTREQEKEFKSHFSNIGYEEYNRLDH